MRHRTIALCTLLAAMPGLAGPAAFAAPSGQSSVAAVGAQTPKAASEIVEELEGGTLDAQQISALKSFGDVVVIDLGKLDNAGSNPQLKTELAKVGTDREAVRSAIEANVPLSARLEDKSVDTSRIVAVTGRPGGTIAVYLSPAAS